jgi:branched-chain amino acid transport system substrate-binding protein
VTFLATFGQYLGVAARQLRNLGAKTPLLTVYEVEDPSVVAVAGKDALEGIRYLVSYTGDDAFERSYEERFGEKPHTFSRNAYDAARLLIDATVRCDFDRPCIREQLYRVRSYQGASGTFDIEPDGGSRKRFYLSEFKDGRFGRVVH